MNYCSFPSCILKARTCNINKYTSFISSITFEVDSLCDKEDMINLIRFRNDQVLLHVPFVALPLFPHFLKFSRHL